MEEIKFIDLFGGIGGFRLGLERASKQFKCVWYNDIDKYAVQVYNKNFNENYEPKDIRQIKTKEIPEFDMLCAGFPCQAFSIAGHRRGFEDTRGTLFFEIARILKDKKPKIVLLENVKGLLNHQKGKTFRVILSTLDELGYKTEWMVLNSKFHGVPQNRERVFIIGYLRGTGRRQILPFRKNAEEVSGLSEGKTFKAHRANEIREHKGSPTLTQNMGTGGHNVPIVMNLQKRDINRPAIRKRIEAGLKPNAGSGTIGKEDEAYCLDAGNNQGVARCLDSNMHKGITPEGYFDKKKRNIVQDVPDVVRDLPPEEKEKILRDMEYMTTLDTSGYARRLGGWNGKSLAERTLRRLTPHECERLQSFPDDWTLNGRDAEGNDNIISDTQRYRQLGNAVTCNVITAIGKGIIKRKINVRNKNNGKDNIRDSNQNKK